MQTPVVFVGVPVPVDVHVVQENRCTFLLRPLQVCTDFRRCFIIVLLFGVTRCVYSKLITGQKAKLMLVVIVQFVEETLACFTKALDNYCIALFL